MNAQKARISEIESRCADAGWECDTHDGLWGHRCFLLMNPDGGGQYAFSVDTKGKILNMPGPVAEALGY